ncbi:Bug family tripartite tricarboxylate transporter substrate binding protein [Cupriavidus pauculus]|uniref:Bug family tripartite tricarboxylate transporter substrate binding protein n=1 Tax=Cupriavidus pauculus TaxID=82633 RepID=UPI000A7813DA|nr:tripartite tricarboxylate transporter substrate binding protein [Cupriavidus pauculus]
MQRYVACASPLPRAVFADNYPSRPVRWLLPFPAGGPTDAIARKLAEVTSKHIGQPIVVENKPGASGAIGTAEVARAAPDGYTFAIAIPDSLISVASLIKSPGYDARKDLTPIMKICQAQPILVANIGLRANTIPELVKLAKAEPGHIAYGSWGAGTLPHLILESLGKATGTTFLDVPYKGLSPALQDLIANHVQLGIVPPILARQLQEKGMVKPLAALGGQRAAELPDLSTIQEQGIETPVMKLALWTALVGPKNLPDAMAKQWAQWLTESGATPEFKSFMAINGQHILARGPATFSRELKEEFAVTTAMIASLGIKPQ